MSDLLQVPPSSPVASPDRAAAVGRFRQVRQASLDMCRPLTAEEYRLQPVADVSPPWWNLGHTSWFFVRNLLAAFGGRLVAEDESYDYLLNSYYASLGPRLERDRRGSVSRPTTDEIYRYRESVDARVIALIETIDESRLDELLAVLAIGLQHEQQHQELFYSEIKFIRFQNPPELREPYGAAVAASYDEPPGPMRFQEFEGGLLAFGHGDESWCWDNERPVHRAWLEPFALAERLVSNGEYLEFIADGGYSDPLLWLDNGWQSVTGQRLRAPLYWEHDGSAWHIWTLAGMRPLDPAEPVCHLSFYEADAYARWRSQQSAHDGELCLPSEREWEHAARSIVERASPDAFLDPVRLHPQAAGGEPGLRQMAGCLWQWTSSYYEPYPGYRPFAGVLAEYNGKFMDNQRVLRGGSCATPRDHYRPTYRNFWPGSTRFQFTGLRLARRSKG